MPISDLDINVNTYAPGLSPDAVAGLPMILGPAATGTPGTVYALDKFADPSVLGVGPLYDHVVDYLGYADKDDIVLAAPVTKSDTGSVGTVDETGVSGLAALVVGAAADMDADIVIECTKGGASAVAQVRVSIDGGNNWEVVNKTVTTLVDIGIPEVGVSAQFDFLAGDMSLGDVWKFTTGAPTVATTAIMDQVDNALVMGYRPEFFVVPVPTDPTDWATFQAQAEYLLSVERPAGFLTQAAAPAALTAAGLQTWKDTLIAQADGLTHPYVVVNAGFATVSQRDGRVRARMLTGIAAGILARSQVHVSIGWRGANPLTNVTLPTAYGNAIATALVDAGYMPLVRQESGSPCFDKARTMSPDNHKFRRTEAWRTVFKAVRRLRDATQPYVESPAWQTAGKQGQATASAIGVRAIVDAQVQALETMTKALPMSELDSFEITVPDGQDLVANGLYEQVELKGIPALEKITLGINFGWAKWSTEIVATG